MITVIIITALAVIIGAALFYIRKKIKNGGGCCGEHEENVRRIKVSDRNKNHYPYKVTLRIGGMTCDNCAGKVENELNGLQGVWSSVDISSKQAIVRMKTPIDETFLRKAVESAGYVVLDYKK